MINEVTIPAFGTSDEDVKLIQWLKNVGDTVKKGDPLCELETDKATTEVESFFDGVLLKQLVEIDSEIPIGTVIAHIGDE